MPSCCKPEQHIVLKTHLVQASSSTTQPKRSEAIEGLGHAASDAAESLTAGALRPLPFSVLTLAQPRYKNLVKIPRRWRIQEMRSPRWEGREDGKEGPLSLFPGCFAGHPTARAIAAYASGDAQTQTV